MLFWPSEEAFWSVTASITTEVKNNHAHVKTPVILNKFPANKFFVGCMVRQLCWYHQHQLSLKTLKRWLSY